MLIEFSVENFKSFRDRTTFGMIAANLKSEDKQLDGNNTIPVSKNLRLLTSAAIYGKNASGKSNFGEALKFMRNFVLTSSTRLQVNQELYIQPFLLNTETLDKPSSFEIIFEANKTQYRYGFEVDKNHVVSEWLYHVRNNREYALFERDGQTIDVRPGFKEGRGLQERAHEKALFLSVAVQWNGIISNQLSEWFFRFMIASGLQDSDFRDFTNISLRHGYLRPQIIDFVKRLDLDILHLANIIIPTVQELSETMPEEEASKFITGWENEIYTAHQIYNNNGDPEGFTAFNLDEAESQGTRKLVAMAGPLHSALEKGEIIFIDEMDARLHTEMTRAIVKLFNSKTTNPHGAQLIFITHDTNLLDNTLFRRDQIWFAEKDKQGATHLVSLADFKERNDADFEKRYLGGRYGGLPSLSDLSATFETAHG